MKEKVVVVTGMGAVASLGLGVEELWSNILQGKSSRTEVSLFETEGCRCRHAAQAPLPPPKQEQKRLSRASRLALWAAEEALQDSGLGEKERKTMGASVSTTGGAMEWGEAFLREVLSCRRGRKFSHVARYLPQQQVMDLQRSLGLTGGVAIFANACASGATAIGHAHDLIRSGMVKKILAGGYEALSELIFVGFDCLQALSPDVCRPFDENRNGLLLGEGAGFLVLEEEEHAKRRGARVRGKILGYGHATDLHHLTQPAPDGRALRHAILDALRNADTTAESIGYVNAHGTGTPANDGTEADVYADVFVHHRNYPWISSTKGAVGHTLGAAGAIEAVITLRALIEGKAPPQVGTTRPLTKVASQLAHMKSLLQPLDFAMTTNLGFGGSNAALILAS